MAALDRAVESLRALVKTNTWEYCIVWKLGDDPSRLEYDYCNLILQTLNSSLRNFRFLSEFACFVLEKKLSCLYICDFSLIDGSFIEWRGCCCSGGNGLELINVKKENAKDQYLFAQCRDEHVQHPIRTKACEKLSKFPLSMPVYSGYLFLQNIKFLFLITTC